MQLRDYQLECLNEIKLKYNEGVRRMAISIATGLGKTVVFSNLPQHLGFKNKILVVAHRIEILHQTAEKLKAFNPGVDVAIDMGDSKMNGERFVCASIQTIGRGGENKRLQAYDPKQFDVIIIDEGHHSIANGYQRIIDYFTEGNPNILLIGFSATWQRYDELDLSQIFNGITYHYGILEGMKNGYLVPSIEAFKVSTEIDLSNVSAYSDDFVVNDLSAAVNIGERNNLIIKTIHTYISNEPTLIFAVDIEHAKDITALLLQRGFNAALVTGDTPKDEREITLSRYKQGLIQFIVNVQVFTEGTDLPSTECLMFARPTKSSLLYIQMIGRGLRPYPGKKSCKVFDFVDNTGKHKIQTLPSLFGKLPQDFDAEGKDILQVVSEIKKVRNNHPNFDFSKIKKLDEIKEVLDRVVNLFDFNNVQELKHLTRFSWIKVSDGSYHLQVKKKWAKIKAVELGVYQGFYDGFAVTPQGKYVETFNAMDRYIKDNFKEELPLIRLSAPWHDRAISPNQLKMLQFMGAPAGYVKDLNRKQAQELISKFTLRNKFGIKFEEPWR